MSKFHDMMMKKRDMKPSEKHAKLGVLKDLKDSLSGAMSDKMDGLKKVSVMSNSPEGMEAGLDKAKQMAGQGHMMNQGGLAVGDNSSEDGQVKYDGTPHDDGFMHPNDSEAYSAGMPMTNKQSMQNSDEPMDVKYMSEGGEATPDEITYSGEPQDDGFMHADSDEADHGASYSEGGRVKKSPLDEAADEADDEREETEGDMGDDAPPMYKGMSKQEVDEHLEHLLRIKKQMEQQ